MLKMRQYIFGVLIVLLGQLSSRALCDAPHENRENRDSLQVADVSNGINGRDTSSAGISSEEDDYDVYDEENSEEKKYANGYSGEYLPGDYRADTYRPTDENVAYWESIYGTDDVPDFEVPPAIDGDSIFMDLGDLQDSWDEENGGEAIPVKRDAGETSSRTGHASSAFRQERNFDTSSGFDYQSMMTNAHRPDFQEQNSSRPKTSADLRSDGYEQFYGSRSSPTASASNLEQQESSRTSENVVRSETRSGTIPNSPDIDSEMESAGLEFAGRFHAAVEPRSIKSNGVAGSLADSKRKIIQAKKDLINVAVAGGSKAEVSHAVHRMIDAKKDLIGSVISTQGGNSEVDNAVHRTFEAKKDLIDSVISGHGGKAEVNHAVQKMINAKKDLIGSVISGRGSKSEFDDVTHRAIAVKKDLIDSVISGQGCRAEIENAIQAVISAKKYLADSVLSAQSYRSKLNNAVRRVVEAKKELIDSVIPGHGSGAEVNRAVHSAIEAKKDLIDSVIFARGGESELSNAVRRAIEAKKYLIDSVISGQSGESILSSAVHRAIDAKKDLLDSVISEHGGIAEVTSALHAAIEAKKELIDSLTSGHGGIADVTNAVHGAIEARKNLVDSVVSARGSEAEFNNAIHMTIEAKKDLLDSVIFGQGSKAGLDNAVHRTLGEKKDLIDSMISTKGSRPEFDNAVHRVIDAKKDLIDSVIYGQGSRAEIENAVEGVIAVKKNLIDSVHSAEGCQSKLSNAVQRVIEAKKELVDSVIPGHGGRAEVNQAVRSAIEAKKDLVDSAIFAQGSASELNNAVRSAIEAKKRLINSVVLAQGGESVLSNAIHRAIDAKKDLIYSTISDHRSILEVTSALHSAIEAKKDLIDLLTFGHGSIAEVTNAVHSAIGAKKGLIDLMISARGSEAEFNSVIHRTIEAKKDLLDSVIFEQGSIPEFNNAVQSVIGAKKDLIDSVISGRGGRAEFDDAVHRTIQAKKDLIDSVISSKASSVQRKKEFRHSASSSSHHSHSYSGYSKSSGLMQSRGAFQSVLDSKQKVIQAKKDLIHASAVGSKAEVGEAVIKTLDAKKDLVDSLLSTRARIIHDRKEFGHSTCSARNTAAHLINAVHRNEGTSLKTDSRVSSHKKEESLNLSSKIQSSSQISSDLELGSVTHQSGVDSLASLGRINLAHSGSSEIDLSSGILTGQDKKGSLHSSLSGSSNIAIGGEVGAISSFGDNNHEQDSSLNLGPKIQSSGQLSSDLELGSITHQNGFDSLASLGKINFAHSGSSETDIASGISTIQDKKDSLHSSLSGSSNIAIGGEVGAVSSFSSSNHKQDSSLNLDTKIQSSGQVSSDLELGSMTHQNGFDSLASLGRINLAHSGSSEIDLSSGISTIQDKKGSLHSSLSGASNIATEGGVEFASNHKQDSSWNLSKKIQTSGQISRAHSGSSETDVTSGISTVQDKKGSLQIQSSGQLSSDLELGSMTHQNGFDSLESLGKIDFAHSGSSGIDIASGISTIQDKKGSLHSSLNGASNIGIEGGVEFASNHNQDSSLNLSKKIQTNGQISSDLEFGSITHQSGDDSVASLGKINSAHSGGSEMDISSGIPTIQDNKGSLHSSLSGASSIAVGGEIGVASSFGYSNHKQDSSLDLSKEIYNSGQISSDLELGAITSQSGVDSLESSRRIDTAAAGSTETKLSIDTISETSNTAADERPEVPISDSNSSSEEINNSDATEIQNSNELSGFSNTEHVSKTGVAKTAEIKSSLSSELALDTDLDLGNVLDSGIKAEGTIGSGISTQLNTDTNIFETRNEEISKPIREECASGLCGISGKLHVESNTQSENRLDEDDGEIPEVNIQSPIIETFIINTEADDQPEEHLKYGDDVVGSESNIGGKTIESVIERTTDVYDDLLSHNEGDHQPEIIGTSKNVEFDDDASQKSFAEPEDAFAARNEEDIISRGQEHLEEKKDSIAINESGDSSIRSEVSFDHRTGLHSEVNGKGAIDLNSQGKISLQIGNPEDVASNEHHGSTYEQKFGKHYSNAAHHHRESEMKGEISHYQCFDGSSHTPLPEDVELYKADGTLAKAHCRLIDLDVNCTGMTAFMRPECQQLNTNLWHPQDSDTPITLWTVKNYLSHGQELAIEMQNRAKWLCDKGLVPKLHTPAMLHLINNLATLNTVEINQESEFSLFGTKLLQRRLSSDFDVTPNTFIEFLQHHAFRVIGTGLCHARPKRCRFNQIYRNFDGSCNNQNNPTWGQCDTAFARILPARYFDGVHEPPRSVTGIELPNPRSLSVYCFSRRLISHPKITLAFSQWGQILSHDFALQTIDQTVEGGIQCCADGKHQLPKKLQHHSCLPIDIPADDKFYSKFESRCMNFVRSMTISREDCTLGPADQLNTVTSYLDVSPLYGSNKETCDQLRSFENGRMLVAVRRGRELLPTMTNRSRFCDVMSPSEVCYLAGDVRVNQNPQLAILQTCLLREHNRIADQLTVLNPHWDDEKVFQEARRIVIAEYQHITYHEWLPSVIGKKYCQKHRLTSRCQDKMSRDYDPRIKAATINSFTTAAFRLFHSMVDGNINLCPANREISHTLRLSNHYFRPQIIERSNNLDDLIRGLVSQPMQQADINFHPEITEYLFRSRNEFGMDLEALDIQRGRDHGLPSYNAFRKTCGLRKAKDFEDLYREISGEGIEKLRRAYAHVDDIDLIVGAAMENKSPGSLLGPVARCLVGEQFYRSRVGDRYFYDNADQPHSFTREQFEEIKKASFARLLCDTGDNIEEIQPQAFKIISRKNPLTCCCALPKVDLSPWQESGCQ